MLSAYPINHESFSLSQSEGISSSATDQFTIIVEKGKQPDKDGFIVQVFAGGAGLSILRKDVAEHMRNIVAAENASITANMKLRDIEQSGCSTRHIEIVLDDSAGISYQTGDHLNIYLVNKPGVVREAAAILGHDFDKAFELEQVSDDSRFAHSAAAAIFGCTCTVSDALQFVCDWKEAPSRELVVNLSGISGIDTDHDSLRKAAEDVNTLGKQSPGWSVFVAENRTVLDVLRRYASLAQQILLATILHFVSAMTPWRYSIASCQSVVGNSVHISAAIVNDIVNMSSYGGLATEYLASLEPGACLSVSHLSAQDAFHLPNSSDVPMIFVGAGTGGAMLNFGCRSSEYNCLYKDELENYMQVGTLGKLQTAFSRIGDGSKYVKHYIVEDGAKIWEHLQGSGRIYVCGFADKLGTSMTATMVRVFEEHCGLAYANTSKYPSDLISYGHYALDI